MRKSRGKRRGDPTTGCDSHRRRRRRQAGAATTTVTYTWRRSPVDPRLRVVAHGRSEHAPGVCARCRRVRRGANGAVAKSRPSSIIDRPSLLLMLQTRVRGRRSAQGRRFRMRDSFVTAASCPDVAARLHTARGPKKLPRVPRRDDAVAMLDSVTEADPDDPRALRDAALLELLYGAGLRVSECCGLDVESVDLRRATVTVLGKGSKVRRLRSAPGVRCGNRLSRSARPNCSGRPARSSWCPRDRMTPATPGGLARYPLADGHAAPPLPSARLCGSSSRGGADLRAVQELGHADVGTTQSTLM
jgi:integrase